jgi:hypothetical protein
MPISKLKHEWDGTLFWGYGYGWRIGDVDGEMTVSHTGTLEGMYSAVTLLPFMKSGYVFMINAEADNARSVLNEVLTKHFTAPDKARSVESYADELKRADEQRRISHVPDTSSRKPVTPAELKNVLGVWRDPWFGEARICARGDTVAKIPQPHRGNHARGRQVPRALVPRRCRGVAGFPRQGRRHAAHGQGRSGRGFQLRLRGSRFRAGGFV